MLEELTKEVNDKPFVNILQQGGDEVIKNSTFCSRILMDMWNGSIYILRQSHHRIQTIYSANNVANPL